MSVGTGEMATYNTFHNLTKCYPGKQFSLWDFLFMVHVIVNKVGDVMVTVGVIINHVLLRDSEIISENCSIYSYVMDIFILNHPVSASILKRQTCNNWFPVNLKCIPYINFIHDEITAKLLPSSLSIPHWFITFQHTLLISG